MFGTTAPDSTQNIRASFSEHFSGFTRLENLKALESDWRLFNALSASTEAEFGPRRSARKALLSISLSAKNDDHRRPFWSHSVSHADCAPWRARAVPFDRRTDSNFRS